MKLRTSLVLLAVVSLPASPCAARSGGGGGQPPQPVEAPSRLALPPTLTAAGTTTALGGQPWGYVVWNANNQDWLDTHDVAVYLRPAAAASFQLQGVMSLLTAPQAIKPWVERARNLGDDLAAATFLTEQLYNQWRLKDTAGVPLPSNAPLPANLEDRLSMLAQRAQQMPAAAAALRQMGNARPLFRFLTGTAWAGPLGVADGQEVVIELRERLRASGAEGGVVGRVTLRAGYVEPLLAPGAPLQVPPPFAAGLPVPNEQPFAVGDGSRLPDLGVALRWAVPEALRRQILLTRGFMVWRVPGRSARGGFVPASAAELDQAARQGKVSTAPGLVRALFRVPAPATKIFRTPAGAEAGESGADVGDFASDRTTWFATDDNARYATDPGNLKSIAGTPYPEGLNSEYYVAAVDLLGRFGALSPAGGGTVVHTLPPQVPAALRVDNIMKNNRQQLRVCWKPNSNDGAAVTTTRYLVYRDRVANQPPAFLGLDRSQQPARQSELIYLGAVDQPADSTPLLSFDDDSLAPAADGTDFGATYFYCIRAAHLGPLGCDASAPCPAVFGTLRNRKGPAAPSGYVATDSPRVDIQFEPPQEQPLGATQVPAGMAMVRVEVERGSTRSDPNGVRHRVLQGVDWIEFSVCDGSDAVISDPPSSPRLHFGEGDTVWYEMPVQVNGGRAAKYQFRAASLAGRLSHRVTLQTDVTLTAGQHYLLKARVLAAPAIEMIPQVLVGQPNWLPFFHRDSSETLQPFAPLDAGPDTLKGAFSDPSESVHAFPRTLLVQVQEFGSPEWTNHDTARLEPGSHTFYFHRRADFQSCLWRVWEIIDPPDGRDLGDASHEPHPAGAQSTVPIRIVMAIPAGTREYRIYRRIDGGALVLLKQASGYWSEGVVDQVMVADALIPPSGATLGYYGQAFDENGNPSPLALLGTKVASLPELPVPMFDPLAAGGTSAAPTMKVRIACPSPGVQYLEVFVEPPVPASAGFQLVDQAGGELFSLQPGAPAGQPLRFTTTLVTSLIAAPDPAAPLLVTAEIPVLANTQYTVSVRCLGPRLQASGFDFTHQAGDRSGERTFQWTPQLAADLVPWPVKPVPQVISFNPLVAAFRTDTHGQTNTFAPGYVENAHAPQQYPVAIRLGRIPFDSNWTVRGQRVNDNLVLGYLGISGITGFDAVPAKADLLKQFLCRPDHTDAYVKSSVTSPLPCVLYRQQTARRIEGASVPTYGTDIVQATPLIDSIAWAPEAGANPQFAMFIDPFVGAAMLEPNRLPWAADLCLFDNSPVAAGATYHYYLAHFAANGEPDAIIDAGSLSFPEAFDNLTE